ncbi:RNA-guided endonuclease TnpB family protein [Acrocarpospora sp. B8E8]|uniref:RNA-guided endonuclease TnpB family protein n=1 Tax=Acrocarpospora sp. B8E8 TaxID=3153572 RepID=UPI00325E8B7A
MIEVEEAGQVLSEADAEIGIDLGLTHYAVLSGGTKIANPRWLRRRAKRLARLQRALSRKEKGSKNREKARIAVARQHAKVADARRDFLHQTSTSIIRENQTVVIEDLAVRGLARSRLAKSVSDASWGTFRTLLAGKAARYGRTVITVGRWFPSSQLCPCCGWRNGKAPLGVRSWDCPSCGEHHDRDLAAALNILAEGLRLRAQAALAGEGQDKDMVAAGLADTRNDCGGRVRPGEAIPTLAPPATYGARAA